MSTARALYDCEGVENSDELSFKKGDVISQVSNSEEEGWLVGVLQTSGQHGLFPANYVEVISDKEESHKPRKPAVAVKPPGIVGSKNNYTVRSSPSIISSSNQSRSKVPEIASVSRSQGVNNSDTTKTSQEIDSPVMSVKALRAKLESTGTVSTAPKKQPAIKEQPKPRTPPVATSPAETDDKVEEEPVETMKPSELRKKWAAVDAASKQSQPVGTPLRTNTKRISTVAETPKRTENTMPVDTKATPDENYLQSSKFVPTPVRSSPGNIPIIQPRPPKAGSPPPPPRRPSTLSNTYSRSSVSSVTEEDDGNNAARPVSYSDRELQVPPRTLPRRPEVQSQIYPSNKSSGPPLPSRPQSISTTSLERSGPTPPPRPTAPPRPTSSKRLSSANPPRPTSHMPPPATSSIRKSIAVVDRIKYEKLFDQHCEQGYVYYEAAFDLWRASRIGDENIGQICHLVDIREDGWLDKNQFCAGMFLIDERLHGVCIPKSLPQGIM